MWAEIEHSDSALKFGFNLKEVMPFVLFDFCAPIPTNEIEDCFLGNRSNFARRSDIKEISEP